MTVPWKLTDEDDYDYYDAWKVVEDEYVNGYGRGRGAVVNCNVIIVLLK